MSGGLDPIRLAKRLREKLIMPDKQQVLISRLQGSKQESDIKAGINCQGYGRLRTTTPVADTWAFDTIVPNEPAASRLSLNSKETELSQLFQIAGCNFRCWFCYVDDKSLRANPSNSRFFRAEELLELFLAEPIRPRIITLTGGQPDLVPEWLPWIMRAMYKLGIADDYFLWMDDNLSTDFAWQFLSKEDWELIRGYRNFAKIACLKSFCEAGFCENTSAKADYFEFQIENFKRLAETGIDLYGYIILTISEMEWAKELPKFMDRLQSEIHENILLRITPLEIKVYTPTSQRVNQIYTRALRNQYEILGLWMTELEKRYQKVDLLKPQSHVSLS